MVVEGEIWRGTVADRAATFTIIGKTLSRIGAVVSCEVSLLSLGLFVECLESGMGEYSFESY